MIYILSIPNEVILGDGDKERFEEIFIEKKIDCAIHHLPHPSYKGISEYINKEQPDIIIYYIFDAESRIENILKLKNEYYAIPVIVSTTYPLKNPMYESIIKQISSYGVTDIFEYSSAKYQCEQVANRIIEILTNNNKALILASQNSFRIKELEKEQGLLNSSVSSTIAEFKKYQENIDKLVKDYQDEIAKQVEKYMENATKQVETYKEKIDDHIEKMNLAEGKIGALERKLEDIKESISDIFEKKIKSVETGNLVRILIKDELKYLDATKKTTEK